MTGTKCVVAAQRWRVGGTCSGGPFTCPPSAWPHFAVARFYNSLALWPTKLAALGHFLLDYSSQFKADCLAAACCSSRNRHLELTIRNWQFKIDHSKLTILPNAGSWNAVSISVNKISPIWNTATWLRFKFISRGKTKQNKKQKQKK